MTVFTVRGYLDSSNNAEFFRVLAGTTVAPPGSVLVDLSRVTFFSAASTDGLYAARRNFGGACTPWKVLGSHAVQRALRITDPADTLPVTLSITEAFRALRPQRETFRTST